MTSKSQNGIGRRRGYPPWCYLEAKAEMEELDALNGRDYVPMDVFVDPRTSSEHFCLASIRARWIRSHPDKKGQPH